MLRIFKKYRCVLAIFFLVSCPAAMYSQIVWATAAGQAWLTATNWTGNIVPSATDIAQFGIAPTSGVTGVGINMNAVTNNGISNQAIGAIEILNTRAANIKIGNSAGSVPGILTLNGAVVNGIADVVLRNNAPGTFTIDNRQALGASTMRIALNDVADNKIYIGNSGNIIINTIIEGAGRRLSLYGIGTGTLQLNAANTYSGLTLIGGAQLQLNCAAGNTLPAANDVQIENGGTLKISSNQMLHNLTLAAGGTLILDPGITLTVNGTFFNNGGSITGTGSIAYGPGAALYYGAVTAQITSSAEFPSIAAPEQLIINNAAGVTLHAARTIAGPLHLVSGNLIVANNNFMAAAVTGAASISTHVVTNGNGKLCITHIETVPVVFPVGFSNTSLNQVAISNGNGADYAVRVEEGFSVPIADPLKAINRTWIIAALSTPAATVDVSFYYSPGEGNALFNYASTVDHGIYLPMGFGWNINQTALPQLGNYYAATKISSFLATTDLPMVLGNLGAILSGESAIQLNGEQKDGHAFLQWDCSGAAVVNEVERAADGLRFFTIAQYPGAVRHATDMAMPPGVNYYRIKTIFSNGTIVYSNTVKLLKKSGGFFLYALYASLENHTISLRLNSDKKRRLLITVTDMQGRRVAQYSYALQAGDNTLQIACAVPASGRYQLTGYCEGQVLFTRSILQ